MPKASKQTASESMTVEGYEGHMEELGGYTVAFETYTADADLSPFFVGLPDDRCQCAHLGYVLKEGEVHVRRRKRGGVRGRRGLPRTAWAHSYAVRRDGDRQSPTEELQNTMESLREHGSCPV